MPLSPYCEGQSAFQPYRAPSKATASAVAADNDDCQSSLIGSKQPSSSSSSSSSPLAEDALGALATDRGDWNVCYLQLHGINFEDNFTKCPQTAAAIAAIPRLYRHSFFSALAPNTHVYKHHGPTNKKLRCHIPLRVPTILQRTLPTADGLGLSPANADGHGLEGCCWLRVADQVVHLEEGKAVVFDDSFEHEG